MPHKDPVKRAACARARSKRWALANPEKVRANWRKHQANNRAKCCAATQRYQLANREKHLASKKRQRNATVAQRKEYARAKHAADPSVQCGYSRAYRAANRQRVLEYYRQYRKNNPDSGRIFNALRRSRKHNAVPASLTESDRAAIRGLYAEARRLTIERGEPYHVDHIIPLSRGGLHELGNLQILRGVDNLRKGNRLIAA